MAARIDTPAVREDVEIDGRRMTPARRKRIIDAHGGVCAYPGCEMTTGLEVDHIIALALGGKDRDENLEPLCGPHHLAKTKRDRKLIAKANRILACQNGTRRERRSIRSAPFRTDLTRGFDGKTKPRARRRHEPNKEDQ